MSLPITGLGNSINLVPSVNTSLVTDIANNFFKSISRVQLAYISFVAGILTFGALQIVYLIAYTMFRSLHDDSHPIITYTKLGNCSAVETFRNCINIKTSMLKRSLLHLAVERNDTDMVWCLLTLGIDINHQDIYLETPLHIAAQKGHIEIVIILCNQDNIQTRKKNHSGYTPKELACLFQHDDIANYLKSCPIKLTLKSCGTQATVNPIPQNVEPDSDKKIPNDFFIHVNKSRINLNQYPGS